ncbi:GTPase [Nanobdella aerobiophila]|nr:GTPase [Nanobdella aerobiophila]
MEIISRSDILLEILDSRFPKSCRLYSIEKYIKNFNKKLILVLNKSDLVPEDFLDIVVDAFNNEFPTVYVSTKTRRGSRLLRKMIKDISNKNKEKIYIGLFGYPNTGKSSISNLLTGRKRSLTSPSPGFTKGLQMIRLSRRYYIIDSPGIILPREEYKMAILGSIRIENIKFPEKAVFYLYKHIGKSPFKDYYNIEFNNFKDLYDKLRKKYNIKDKNWIKRISIIILNDWYKGNIRGYWL